MELSSSAIGRSGLRPGLRVALLLALAAGPAGADEVFKYGQAFPVQSRSEAVAIGDLNSDGRNDVALVTSVSGDGSPNNGCLLLFLQASDGTLQPYVRYFVGNNVTSVAIGDLNGDDRNDVVAATQYGIRVLLQKADATLGAPVFIEDPNGTMVRVADLNNDGRADVVSLGWATSTVSVFLQASDGSLAPPVHYPAPLEGFDDIDVGDANGDGLADVVVMTGAGHGPSTSILPQMPDGTLGPPQSYSIPPSLFLAHGVGIGDVSGDGRSDLVTSFGGNRSTAGIAVFIQNETGTMEAPVSLPSYDIPAAVDVADMDHDGLGDIVVAHQAWNALGIYLQKPDHSFAAERLYGIPYYNNWGHSVATGDFDGDGWPDVAVADQDAGLVALYNAGPPRAAIAPASLRLGVEAVGFTSAPQFVTVRNVGYRSLRVTGVAASGSFTATNECPDPLPVGQVCRVAVRVAPTTLGSLSGDLEIATNEETNTPYHIALVAVGARLALSPTALRFALQPVNTVSPAQSVVLRNSTLAPLSVVTTLTGDYQKLGSCPASLAAGASCTVSIAFKPKATGMRSGALSFVTSRGILSTRLGGGGYVGKVVAVDRPNIDFGLQLYGEPGVRQPLILTNPNIAPRPLQFSTTGEFRSETNCPSVLAIHATCQVEVLFVPSSLGDRTGTLMIDDGLKLRSLALKGASVPGASVEDVWGDEGNSGTTQFVFTVSLSPAPVKPVTVSYETIDREAVQPGDYVRKVGSVTFGVGQTHQTVAVAVKGDTQPELRETFLLGLTGATNAMFVRNFAYGVIENDEAVPGMEPPPLPRSNEPHR